jgi:hypothetical protein
MQQQSNKIRDANIFLGIAAAGLVALYFVRPLLRLSNPGLSHLLLEISILLIVISFIAASFLSLPRITSKIIILILEVIFLVKPRNIWSEEYIR